MEYTNVDAGWTLFLDRDGVINYDMEDGYVLNKSQFQMLDGVPEALKILKDIFEVIVVVTNQRGVGKGLMTVADLDEVHGTMLQQIEAGGGRIDRIYFAPEPNDDSFNRKPNPGMAYRAQQDFPSIEFSKSIMVGNRMTDMAFGRNAGMATVYLTTTHPEVPYPNELTDARFSSLLEFAQQFTTKA